MNVDKGSFPSVDPVVAQFPGDKGDFRNTDPGVVPLGVATARRRKGLSGLIGGLIIMMLAGVMILGDQADFDNADPAVVGPGVAGEQRKGFIGLIGGLVIIVLGVVMIFAGVTGSVDFLMRSGGSQVHVQTAVVGVVVCVLGTVVVWITRPIIKVSGSGDTGRGTADGKNGHARVRGKSGKGHSAKNLGATPLDAVKTRNETAGNERD
jgi:hypothetical protein